MRNSFSDRGSSFRNLVKRSSVQASKKIKVQKNEHQHKLSMEKISQNEKSRANYIHRLVNTQSANIVFNQVNFNVIARDKSSQKENIQIYAKSPSTISRISKQPVKSILKSSISDLKSRIIKNNSSQKNLSKIDKTSTDRSTKPNTFEQIGRSLPKNSTNTISQQPFHKRFDITNIDFSANFNKSKQKFTQSITKSNQYSGLVQTSRTNIKRIIELNKLIKENNDRKISDQIQSQSIVMDNIQILQTLKTGCFGTIFKARLKDTGKLVAIKSVPYDRKYYQRQEQLCKMVDNNFIVKVHQVYYSYDIPNQQHHCKQSQKQGHITNQLKVIQKTLSNLPATTFNKTQTVLPQNTTTNFPTNPTKHTIRQIDQSKNGLNTQSKKSTIKGKPCPLKQHFNQYHRIINIVMDLYDCDLNDYIMMKHRIDNLTLKIFAYQMLRSVLYIHSHQICHRDIKPHNFLVKKHLLVLTDFGSAKIMKNHKNSNVAYICSRYYRAPQLVLGYKYYDKSIDIWSLGCVMAQLCLGKPIFAGSNSLDQLVKIIKIIGQPNWRKISFMIDKIPKLPDIQPKGLKNIFPHQVSPLFIDLLENMLVFNPLHRITAGQALCHSYFDQIRDQMNFQQICKQMDISHFLSFNRDELKQNEHLKNKLIPLWMTQSDKNQTLKENNFFNS